MTITYTQKDLKEGLGAENMKGMTLDDIKESSREKNWEAAADIIQYDNEYGVVWVFKGPKKGFVKPEPDWLTVPPDVHRIAAALCAKEFVDTLAVAVSAADLGKLNWEEAKKMTLGEMAKGWAQVGLRVVQTGTSYTRLAEEAKTLRDRLEGLKLLK